MKVPLPIACTLVCALFVASTLSAQTKWSGSLGVHPHMAPVDGSIPSVFQPISPMFNLGTNGVWDLGEGLVADTGGALGFDDGTGIQLWNGATVVGIQGATWFDPTVGINTIGVQVAGPMGVASFSLTIPSSTGLLDGVPFMVQGIAVSSVFGAGTMTNPAAVVLR